MNSDELHKKLFEFFKQIFNHRPKQELSNSFQEKEYDFPDMYIETQEILAHPHPCIIVKCYPFGMPPAQAERKSHG